MNTDDKNTTGHQIPIGCIVVYPSNLFLDCCGRWVCGRHDLYIELLLRGALAPQFDWQPKRVFNGQLLIQMVHSSIGHKVTVVVENDTQEVETIVLSFLLS